MSTPFIIEPTVEGKNGRRRVVIPIASIATCHSEVFRGILPDPSEYLGVTGANGLATHCPPRNWQMPRNLVTTPNWLGQFHIERNGAH